MRYDVNNFSTLVYTTGS